MAETVQDITPERARELLDNAYPSRRPSQRVIVLASEAMRAGTFTGWAAGILLTPEGRLNRGHDILRAVVQVGFTVPVRVEIGAGGTEPEQWPPR